jgi:hypothetical protein
MSEALRHVPVAAFDYVYVDDLLAEDAEKWLKEERNQIIQLKESEETDGSTSA